MKKTLKFVIAALVVVLIGLVVFVVKNSFEETKSQEVSKIFGANSEAIPVAMAADNNYVYPTLVSMTSVLENARHNTKYEFHLMVPSDFTEENKSIIRSLEKKYKRCSINIIDMGNAFKEANSDTRITTPAYYRLNLSELLPNLDKIIWLDGDTITFKDLTDMINLDMNGYYYKGFIDSNVDGLAPFGIKCKKYICSGVMLINLKALRNDNIHEKFLKCMEDNKDKLVQHDQTVINLVCYNKIGILPPRFGMFNFKSLDDVIEYNKALSPLSKWSMNEVESAYKDPSIIHYVAGKPWKDSYAAFKDKWWNYAEKTDYYNVILQKYE